jgi:hypothetical protein
MCYRFLAALTMLASFLPVTWSQDCVPGPGPNSLLKTSDAVFVGSVTAMNNDTVQFHVTEAFKGVAGDHYEVVEVNAVGFTGFEIGKQYLVFAYTFAVSDETKYHIARGCGLTEELKYAQALLEQVRAERGGRRVSPVYGTLLRTFPEGLAWDESYEQPLSGIVIRLRSDHKSYETKTDANGVYAFSRIRPGTYQVSADLPPNLELSDPILPGQPSPFELPSHSSFDYELTALPTGRISGRVMGPDGKPVTITSVELYAADLFASDRRGLFASQIDGKPFVFFQLPPGDYVLVFNRQSFTSPDAPFHQTFYPNTPNVESATRIHLSDGQRISNADIHVKDPIPTRKITVQLHWNGRTPADYYPPQIIIEASEEQSPYPFKAGPDTYEANLFLTARYTIRAQILCRSHAKSVIDTPAVTIDGADTSTSSVDLTFGKGECLPN